MLSQSKKKSAQGTRLNTNTKGSQEFRGIGTLVSNLNTDVNNDLIVIKDNNITSPTQRTGKKSR